MESSSYRNMHWSARMDAWAFHRGGWPMVFARLMCTVALLASSAYMLITVPGLDFVIYAAAVVFALILGWLP